MTKVKMYPEYSIEARDKVMASEDYKTMDYDERYMARLFEIVESVTNTHAFKIAELERRFEKMKEKMIGIAEVVESYAVVLQKVEDALNDISKRFGQDV